MAKKGRSISTYTKKGKEKWEAIIMDCYHRLYEASVDKDGNHGDFDDILDNADIIDTSNNHYKIDFGSLEFPKGVKYLIKKEIISRLGKNYVIDVPYLDYEITMDDEIKVYESIQEDYNMTKQDVVRLKMKCDMGCSPKFKDYDPSKQSIMSKWYDKN